MVFGLFACAPHNFFLKFCLVACRPPSLSLRKVDFLAGGNLFSFFFVGSVGHVSAVFVAAVSHGLGTQPAGVRAFRMRSPSTFFLSFAWWLAGFQVFRCAKLPSLLRRQSFFFLFSGFRRQRFGRFCGCGFAWLGHATCWGSGFSHALPKHFFLKFCLVACRLPSLSLHKVDFLAGGNLFSFFLVGSVGNVSLRD